MKRLRALRKVSMELPLGCTVFFETLKYALETTLLRIDSVLQKAFLAIQRAGPLRNGTNESAQP